jgi:hypothetical protein
MFQRKDWIEKIDRWMVALTFAEAGYPDTALEMMGRPIKHRRRKRLDRREERRADNRPTLHV